MIPFVDQLLHIPNTNIASNIKIQPLYTRGFIRKHMKIQVTTHAIVRIDLNVLNHDFTIRDVQSKTQIYRICNPTSLQTEFLFAKIINLIIWFRDCKSPRAEYNFAFKTDTAYIFTIHTGDPIRIHIKDTLLLMKDI